MKNLLYLTFLIITVCGPNKAVSEQWFNGSNKPITVRDFVIACSKKGGIWLTFCGAYVQGVSDYAHDLRNSGYTQLFYSHRGQLFCQPKHIPQDQIIKIFLLWASENPQSWNLIGASGVAAALAQTWPCKP